MELRNLDRAIVNVLGDVRSRKNQTRHTDLKRIFEKFADIPGEQVKAALRDLHHRQMIGYTSDSKNVFLTDKGVNTLRSDMHGSSNRLKIKE